MVRNVEISTVDGETFIEYWNENDFEYTIYINQKCKVITDSKEIIGTVVEIKGDSFTVQKNEGELRIIMCSDICNIYGEEEVEELKGGE